MARRTRTIWFFNPLLLVILLAAWVGLFGRQSRADTSSFRFAVSVRPTHLALCG